MKNFTENRDLALLFFSHYKYSMCLMWLIFLAILISQVFQAFFFPSWKKKIVERATAHRLSFEMYFSSSRMVLYLEVHIIKKKKKRSAYHRTLRYKRWTKTRNHLEQLSHFWDENADAKEFDRLLGCCEYLFGSESNVYFPIYGQLREN